MDHLAGAQDRPRHELREERDVAAVENEIPLALDQRIDVTCDANIARFGVSAAGAGMNFGAPLEVCLDLDPNGSDVWILDTPRPSALARGNPPQSQLIFWANDTLVLMEWQGESVRWFATLP